jgi:fructose/tagatose bisphosphate aldolase
MAIVSAKAILINASKSIVATVYKTLAASVSIPICLHLDHCEDLVNDN